jgi:NADPH:quinone reductase-like Zn-dependent oxidoreductase/NAD(P)-dependent dehydrogenase (short-subunit alcohol dehydrogenase family)/aryl carrier-like protein
LSQPICTALQVAIVDLLASWKVRASISVGHSSGEIVAAYASGAISRESAWMISYFRGLAVAITQDLSPSAGGMMAIQAPLDSWKQVMDEQNTAHSQDPVVIACYNSPASFTVSGPLNSILALASTLKEANIEVHVLKIDVAYHSHHMKPVAGVYGKLLRTIEQGEQSEEQPLFVSTVIGKPLERIAELRTSEYWNKNLTGSVQFLAALQSICSRKDASTYVFLEIGPHSVLRSPLSDILKSSGRDVSTEYSSMLRRDWAADTTALECAGKLHVMGVSVDIAAVNASGGPSPRLLTSIPSYQFEDKKKYWLEGRTSIQYRQTRFPHHELLGSRTPDWNEHEARWTNRILLDQSPYLKEHQINGLCLMPAAGMLVMAIEAVRQFHGDRAAAALGYKIKDVTFTKAMTLSGDPRGTEIQLTLKTATSQAVTQGCGWDHFSLYVYEDGRWHLCCAGSVAIEYKNLGDYTHLQHLTEKKQTHLAGLQECRSRIDSSEVYRAFDQAGLAYGATFRGMRDVAWDQDSQATGTIGLRDWESHTHLSSDEHFIHPAALDTILQTTFPAYSIYAKDSSATTVPTGFSNAWFSADLARASSESKEVSVHAKVSGRGFRNKLFAISATLVDTQELCFYGDLETSTIGRSGPCADVNDSTKSLYRIDWQTVDFDHILARPNASAPAKSCVHVVYDESSSTEVHLVRCIHETNSSHASIGTVLVPWASVTEHELANTICVFLPGLDGSFLRKMRQDDLEKIKSVVSVVDALIWVTFQHHALDQSPSEGLVSGLVRTLATESDVYRLVGLSLDGRNGPEPVAANIAKVARTLLQPQTDPEDEYCEIEGRLCIPRVVDDVDMVAQALPSDQSELTVAKSWYELDGPKLTIGAAGMLSTLHYEQDPPSADDLAPNAVLVEVKAVGLNSRDLLVALGQVHDEAFGSEIAGVILQAGPSSDGLQVGDRVFGVARDGVAKSVRCKAFQLQKMPSHIDFTTAAAYPVAFCTAYYSLVHFARIESGEAALIHRGAGALGQAAIQIAQLYGCDIYVTVETDDEMAFLENTYGIPKSHILSSANTDFGDAIRRLTRERGVDVVLNQLADGAAPESWACIAPFGRFIDVTEKDVFVGSANGPKGTFIPPMTKNVMFASVNFPDLVSSQLFAKIFQKVYQLIADNKVHIPNPLMSFAQSDVEQAFRALQSDKLVGKVVIEMKSDETVEMELSPNAKPLFHADATYLVAGAFGGIGQSITRWMVKHGAKHLILPSRSDVVRTDREKFVQDLQMEGSNIYAPTCDIADRDQLQEMLGSLQDLPPIKGCIQAAMVMRDSSFAKMPIDKWQESLAPKVDGSWNLHQLLPSGLDFFVMLSSSTGIMGSFGQSNYTVGNTYQDALAAHRMKHGQRAHTLALSMVTGVGYVAQNEQVQALLRVRGMLEEVPMDDIYQLLHFCCDSERVDASTCGSQIITPLTLPADLRAMGIVAPLGSTRPIYRYLDTLPARFSTDASASAEAKKRPSYLLGEATSLAHATDIVVEAVQTQLSSLLVVSKDDIDPQKAIYRYGVDSLVAVEMRNWFSKAIGADVGTADIMSDISIWLLAVKVASKSKFVREELKE